MRKFRLNILCLIAVIAIMLLMSCKGGDESDEAGKETQSTNEELSEGETSDVQASNNETTSAESEEYYKYNPGTGWLAAYSEKDYQFYYMNISAEEYDSSVVMSVTDDESLRDVDKDELKESLKKQYGGDIKLEDDTVGNHDVIYVELKEESEESAAYVGQYIVLGKKGAVIFSVYAKEASFKLAKEKTRNVINTIEME